jgi:hypothetical protein
VFELHQTLAFSATQEIGLLLAPRRLIKSANKTSWMLVLTLKTFL